MKPHAKARSAEATQGRRSRVARIFRAFATRGASAGIGGLVRVGFPRRVARVLVPVPFVVLAVAFALPLVSAFASESGPPLFRGELLEEEVYATRAHVEAYVEAGDHEAPEAKWQAEYAPAELDGKAPLANSGPWIACGSGTSEGNFNVACGAQDATGTTMLHHLLPATIYYVRFHVENKAGLQTEETYKFTTTAVAKPEVAKNFSGHRTEFHKVGRSLRLLLILRLRSRLTALRPRTASNIRCLKPVMLPLPGVPRGNCLPLVRRARSVPVARRMISRKISPTPKRSLPVSPRKRPISSVSRRAMARVAWCKKSIRRGVAWKWNRLRRRRPGRS